MKYGVSRFQLDSNDIQKCKHLGPIHWNVLFKYSHIFLSNMEVRTSFSIQTDIQAPKRCPPGSYSNSRTLSGSSWFQDEKHPTESEDKCGQAGLEGLNLTKYSNRQRERVLIKHVSYPTETRFHEEKVWNEPPRCGDRPELVGKAVGSCRQHKLSSAVDRHSEPLWLKCRFTESRGVSDSFKLQIYS